MRIKLWVRAWHDKSNSAMKVLIYTKSKSSIDMILSPDAIIEDDYVKKHESDKSNFSEVFYKILIEGSN